MTTAPTNAPVSVVLDPATGTKPAPRWKGHGYLPYCTKTKGCLCATVERMAGGASHIEAPGCRLVKVPTSDRHLQVRLECKEHHNVGGPLPAHAQVAGEAIDPRALPDSHNTTDYIAYLAKRGPVQP